MEYVYMGQSFDGGPNLNYNLFVSSEPVIDSGSVKLMEVVGQFWDVVDLVLFTQQNIIAYLDGYQYTRNLGTNVM